MKKVTEIVKNKPLAPFLYAVFFFMHTALNYLHWLYNWKPVYYLSATLLVILLLYKLSNYFFKHSSKAVLFSLAVIWFVFYYKFFINTISSYSGIHLNTSYALILISALLVAAVYIIKRVSDIFALRLNYFFNVLFITFIAVDAVMILDAHQKRTYSYTYDSLPETNVTSIPKDSLPDIYFIIFDEYASSRALQNYFDCDNSRFDTFLKQKGFYISMYSNCAYVQTAMSIASTLQMNYAKQYMPNKLTDVYYAAYKSMQQNNVFDLLEKSGYQIHNHSIFDFKNYPTTSETIFEQASFLMFFDRTLVKQFLKLYLYFFNSERKTYAQDMIKQVASPPASLQPSFYYIHTLVPHYPFVYHADGTIKSPFLYLRQHSTESISAYCEQVQYLNTIIMKMVTVIQQNNPNAIIILQGDHGLRLPYALKWKNELKYKAEKAMMQNLNAIYFPTKKYDMLYDSISPINTFRVVANTYWGQNFPLIKDSICY